jgi:hypothetical protein
VSRFLIGSLAIVTAVTYARADGFSDMAEFAQSICGDIPEGNLTRTSIEGKIGANIGLLAKVMGGDASASGSRSAEIYKGIPFEKLPDRIPTVAMCKSELVKLLVSQKSQTTNSAPGGIIQNGNNNVGNVTNDNK